MSRKSGLALNHGSSRRYEREILQSTGTRWLVCSGGQFFVSLLESIF